MIGTKLNNIWTNLNPNEIRASFPSGEVLVFHDGMAALGPASDPDLLTWEDGKVTVKGDLIGNLIQGEISSNTPGNIAVNEQDVWIQISSFNVNGVSNGTTPDHTNDHITILETGKYLVLSPISASSQQANDYEYMVKTNNGTTDYDNLKIGRSLPVAGAKGAQPILGVGSFTANDTVEIWVQRLDGGSASRTLTVEHINLNLILIGK